MVSTWQETKNNNRTLLFWLLAPSLLLAMNIQVLRYHKICCISNIWFLIKASRASTVYTFSEQLESISNAQFYFPKTRGLAAWTHRHIHSTGGFHWPQSRRTESACLKGKIILYIIKIIYVQRHWVSTNQPYRKSHWIRPVRPLWVVEGLLEE